MRPEEIRLQNVLTDSHAVKEKKGEASDFGHPDFDEFSLTSAQCRVAISDV